MLCLRVQQQPLRDAGVDSVLQRLVLRRHREEDSAFERSTTYLAKGIIVIDKHNLRA